MIGIAGHDWNCRAWGINVNVDGRNYQQYKPFSLSSVVLGPFIGHIDHDLHYDERMDTKDDYDFSLQMLSIHRKILRINKYSYLCAHGINKGGIVSHRTHEREKAACIAIMKKWGSKIIKYKINDSKRMGDLLNGKVNVPIAGV